VEDIERDVAVASRIVRLREKQSIVGMSIAPDGKTLVFSLCEEIQDEMGRKKKIATLRSIDTSGSGVTQLTTGKWMDTNPSVTKDGKNLIFDSDRLRRRQRDIFQVSMGRSGGVAVLHQTPEGLNYQSSVAEDGTIAYTYKPNYGRHNIESQNQIWTIGGQNQYPTQLREGSEPAMSPDGKTIAFIGKDKQLWTIPASGLSPMRLTDSEIFEEGRKNPAWSSSGKYIIYASEEGKDSRDAHNYDLWIIKADGTGKRQLTTNGSKDIYPVVSPDEKYIYFVSNRGFKEGIWRIPFPSM
jgi:Tol biopolymer transport system component